MAQIGRRHFPGSGSSGVAEGLDFASFHLLGRMWCAWHSCLRLSNTAEAPSLPFASLQNFVLTWPQLSYKPQETEFKLRHLSSSIACLRELSVWGHWASAWLRVALDSSRLHSFVEPVRSRALKRFHPEAYTRCRFVPETASCQGMDV